MRSKQNIYRIHLQGSIDPKRLDQIDVGEIARFRASATISSCSRNQLIIDVPQPACIHGRRRSSKTPDHPRVRSTARTSRPSLAVKVAKEQRGGDGPRGHVGHTRGGERAEQVEAFYRAALEAGGKDNGAPGRRPQYSGNYYAAFVIGPDGHNIEVVCHEPEA
ncbi:MAG TPA: hypothetical protein VFT22_22010 [Kofleriaceae bacterium]|nr:hypothetical protein [Kofleriaceae bacterium]